MLCHNSILLKDQSLRNIRGGSEDGGAELRWLNENLGTLINKRLAHLTAYRQRVPKETHLIDMILQYMMVIVERFTARVPEDMKCLLKGFPDKG